MNKIKRIAIILISAMLLFAFTLSASASSITGYASSVRMYLMDNVAQSDEWEENFILSTLGIRNDKMTSAYDANANAETIAKAIIMSLTADTKTDENASKLLASKQLEDGSFGDLFATLYSVIALTATKTIFESQKAVRNLLTYQFDEGFFYFSDPRTADVDPLSVSIDEVTGRVVEVLSYFKADAAVQSSIDKAVSFLTKERDNGNLAKENTISLSHAVTALADCGISFTSGEWRNTFDVLKSRLRRDGAFVVDFDSETSKIEDLSPDTSSTFAAYTALDAADREGNSIYLRLMKNGSTSAINSDDLKTILLPYAAVAAAAVVFWLIIIFRKPDKHKNNNKSDKRIV